MSVHCPHCDANVGSLIDPSDLPWEEGENKKLVCVYCQKEFWLAVVVSISWKAFGSEEEMDTV